MNLRKLAIRGVLCGAAVALAVTLFQPTTVRANSGERWYDYAERKWKKGRKPSARRYASNKSPIRKRVVRFDASYAPGTIVVDTSERRLYYVMKRGRAMKYGIGVGRDGFQWQGTHRVTRKAEWPGWTPPRTMIRRVKRETGQQLKSYYPGGPNNPLGARALYIGSTIYRIHGTNQPWTIGQAMSSGCIRLANDDVTDLYNRVNVGAKVIVRN
ncbi:MAG: L,D-transpeptidase [Rhizobiaceae bacterium]